jgi:hypothetical protein
LAAGVAVTGGFADFGFECLDGVVNPSRLIHAGLALRLKSLRDHLQSA